MINKKILNLIIILLFISGITTSLYLYLNGYNFEQLKIILGENILLISLFFLIIFSLRIFLFIPSTVIIIGLGFLTNDFILTLIISTIGVLVGLIQAYFIGYIIEGDIENNKLFKNIKPYIEKYKENGFRTTFIGALLPILPTDIICYSAGFSRYSFKKFLLAGILGELPLIILYSYLGKEANFYIDKINYISFYIIIFFIIYFIIKKYIPIFNKK